MARVPVAVVDDVELVRRERLLEPRSNHGNAVCRHGRTWISALMSTSPNTS
jgi:hypothetical protein